MPRARRHPRGRPRGRRPDDGASAVEYAVLLAGAVLGIFAVIVGLKSSFGAAFSDASANQAVVSDGSTVALFGRLRDPSPQEVAELQRALGMSAAPSTREER